MHFLVCLFLYVGFSYMQIILTGICFHMMHGEGTIMTNVSNMRFNKCYFNHLIHVCYGLGCRCTNMCRPSREVETSRCHNVYAQLFSIPQIHIKTCVVHTQTNKQQQPQYNKINNYSGV